jgi:hypothetical protein
LHSCTAGEQTDVEELRRLEPLVGTWRMDASFAGAGPGTARFEWVLDRRFLIEWSEAPGAPDGIAIVGLDPDGGYVQHYFDSRGIARVYAMTFGDGTWTLLRDRADFTPLGFARRFTANVDEDAGTIHGRWERSDDGGVTWEHDFDLTYTKTA